MSILLCTEERSQKVLVSRDSRAMMLLPPQEQVSLCEGMLQLWFYGLATNQL